MAGQYPARSCSRSSHRLRHLIQEDTVRRLYFTVVAKPVERKQVAQPTSASHGSAEPEKKAPKKAVAKVGRNDPCPCGSGKKYKQCCGKAANDAE